MIDLNEWKGKNLTGYALKSDQLYLYFENGKRFVLFPDDGKVSVEENFDENEIFSTTFFRQPQKIIDIFKWEDLFHPEANTKYGYMLLKNHYIKCENIYFNLLSSRWNVEKRKTDQGSKTY